MDMKTTLLAAALTVASAGANAVTVSEIVPGLGYGDVNDSGQSYVRLTDTDGVSDDSRAYVLLNLEGTLGTGDPISFGIFDEDSTGTINYLNMFSSPAGFLTPARIDFDLASGIASVFGQAGTIETDGEFGFFLEAGGNYFHSDATLNDGGLDYALLFNTRDVSTAPTDMVIAFTDVNPDAPNFANVAIGINDVTPVPVPPALVLMGLGIAGLGAARRKLANKSDTDGLQALPA